MTQEGLEKLIKVVTRRYRLFASGYLTASIGTCFLLGMFNPFIGGAALMAGVAYVLHVNMAVLSDNRDRLREMEKYLGHGLGHLVGSGDALPGKRTHGQYL